MPKENEPKQSRRTITLTFSDEDEGLYDEIVLEAKMDRRSPSQYLLLYLSKNHKPQEITKN